MTEDQSDAWPVAVVLGVNVYPDGTPPVLPSAAVSRTRHGFTERAGFPASS